MHSQIVKWRHHTRREATLKGNFFHIMSVVLHVATGLEERQFL